MKTVIVQSLIGEGVLISQGDSAVRKHRQLERVLRYCVPSVQAYAARHGCSYIFHKAAQPHFSVVEKPSVQRFTRDVIPHASPQGVVVTLSAQQRNACFEPYYVMNELSALYERFIYLDLDIYIKPNAPAMPHGKGVWAAVEWQVPHDYHAKRGFADVPHSHQFNSGVLVMDCENVRSLYRHFRQMKEDVRCTGGDQDYFRLWSLKNKVHRLEDVWNYIVSFHQNRDGHFIHYVVKDWIVLELGTWYGRLYHRALTFLKACERRLRQTRIYGKLRRWKKKQ